MSSSTSSTPRAYRAGALPLRYLFLSYEEAEEADDGHLSYEGAELMEDPGPAIRHPIDPCWRGLQESLLGAACGREVR